MEFYRTGEVGESVLTQAFLFSDVLICFTLTLSENETRDTSSSNRLSNHFHRETRGASSARGTQSVTGRSA